MFHCYFGWSFKSYLIQENRKSKQFVVQRDIVDELNEKFGTSRIGFSWIDGTCHAYLLKALDLQEDSLPQIVAYYPGKQMYYFE